MSYAPSFAYQDFQYFLTQGNGPWGNRTWTYDTIGNRLSFARSSEPTQTYAYASPGHNPKLSTITPAPGWGTGAWSFSYDAAGNQTSIAESNNEGAVQTTVYDFAGDSRLNAMRTTSPTGPARTDVLYDGRGFLRQAHLTVTGSDDNVKATPLYSSAGMLMARTEERTWTGATTGPDGEDQTFAWLVSDTTQLFYFAGRPVAQLTNPGAELLYITTDHLGTPALVTNAGGAATWAGGLEPFGAPWTAGLDRPDPEPVSSGGGRFRLATAALERLSMEEVFLRYPGQWSSDAFRVGAAQGDVYYNVNRWYQPGTGRYERPDPQGKEGDPHPYVYALGRPTGETDPLGLDSAGCSVHPILRALIVQETPCILQCCASHDKCYDDFNCSDDTWTGTGGAGCGFKACNSCNTEIAQCILACRAIGILGFLDDPNRPNYYCARTGQFLDVPGRVFGTPGDLRDQCQQDHDTSCCDR